MNFASIFRRGSTSSEKTFDRTEKKLWSAHNKIKAFAAAVDMNYLDYRDNALFNNQWQGVVGAKGVRQIECALPTKLTTLLNVVFQPDSEIPPHFHEQQEETIFVVEGSIIDKETNTKISQGQTYVIPAKQVHHMYSLNGALLNVLFRPKFVAAGVVT